MACTNDTQQAQLKRECLLMDVASRLPSNYHGWIVSTEQVRRAQ